MNKSKIPKKLLLSIIATIICYSIVLLFMHTTDIPLRSFHNPKTENSFDYMLSGELSALIDSSNLLASSSKTQSTGQITDVGGYRALTLPNGTTSSTIAFDDGSTYQGEVKNHMPDGNGTLKYSNGDIYEGEFKGGLRNGEGTYTWKNGEKYEGYWKNDLFDGKGTIILSSNIVMTGTFENGKLRSGQITKSFKGGQLIESVENGSVESPVKIQMDDGTCVETLYRFKYFLSEATIYYYNGDKYEGELFDGYKSGEGIYTWENGAHYIGHFQNDLIDGEGTYFYSDSDDGERLIGNFSEGVPSGTLTYYSSTKLKYITTWKNGVCTSIKDSK